jgi:hypothetical protein
MSREMCEFSEESLWREGERRDDGDGGENGDSAQLSSRRLVHRSNGGSRV